jgi:glutamate 5-kinase
MSPGQLQFKAALLRRARRVVIKIGSSILSSATGIDRARLRRMVGEIHAVTGGRQVVVVSSGAVAAGVARLGLKARPRSMPQRQAAAAVGQIDLMALYEEYFDQLGHRVAQVLLTHEDLANRRRYINARHAFEALLQAGVVPVVNENDTVAVEEMRFNFGDNDNLSALVATLVSADLLVILSDVDGLYTSDPAADRNARLVSLVGAADRSIERYVVGPAGPLGTGGMASKVSAAFKANEAGVPCIIADGLNAGVLPAVFDAKREVGTLFLPAGDPLQRRKHWIAHTLKPAGSLAVDAGARRAVVEQGRSLLPKGVAAVRGSFGAGECVSCLDAEGREFARGLVSYAAAEIEKIKGLHSKEIESALGYRIGDEVIHRDDLVVLAPGERRANPSPPPRRPPE